MPNSKHLNDDGINISAEGNVTIHGDVIGGDKYVIYTHGLTPEQVAAFLGLQAKIAAAPLEVDDKEDLTKNVERIQVEVQKGEQADGTKIESALKKIAGMSDDILDVVLATLTNPALGLAEVVRKVAAKARNN